jgi:hypothetical protein
LTSPVPKIPDIAVVQGYMGDIEEYVSEEEHEGMASAKCVKVWLD